MLSNFDNNICCLKKEKCKPMKKREGWVMTLRSRWKGRFRLLLKIYPHVSFLLHLTFLSLSLLLSTIAKLFLYNPTLIFVSRPSLSSLLLLFLSLDHQLFFVATADGVGASLSNHAVRPRHSPNCNHRSQSYPPPPPIWRPWFPNSSCQRNPPPH